MMITLPTSFQNKVPLQLSSTTPTTGDLLEYTGFGTTAPDDGNDLFPQCPVHIDDISAKYPCRRDNAVCMDSGSASPEMACSGDSGGAWIRWAEDACFESKWPKSRACAISLGHGSQSQGYTYIDGTGLWCSSADGGRQLTLSQAQAKCSSGSYQGLKAPCVGIVFNGEENRDEGRKSSKYTTCWKMASTGLGWQVLLKPVQSSSIGAVQPLPKTAIAMGVNSFGSDACGSTIKRSGFYPTTDAKDWIEDIAPGHFVWSS
jgi:hypothetical protein